MRQRPHLVSGDFMRLSLLSSLFMVFAACSTSNPISLVKVDASHNDIVFSISPSPDTAIQPEDTRSIDAPSTKDTLASTKLDTGSSDLALPKDTTSPKLDVMPAKLDAGILIGNPTPNSWLLIVGDPEDLEPGEKALIEHSKQRNQPLVPLEARNFNSSESSAKTAVNYVNGRKGVVISGSGSSSSLEAVKAFKNYPTPVIALFDRAYNSNGTSAWLTPISTPDNKKAAGSAEGNQVEITANAGELAAGLTGLVTVMSSEAPMFWGIPQSSSVIIVGTIPSVAGAAAIFAYPIGATMDDGSIAPAARAGFFMNTQEASGLSADGYKLFDTLLDWAAAQ
jgi:hypothetical protein